MKLTAIIILFSLVSCNKESSPEGRMQIKYEKLEQKIEALEKQNTAVLDSISVISKRLSLLKHE